MNFNEYQKECKRTRGEDFEEPLNTAVLALGISGEAGEIADYIKKTIAQGHPFDVELLVLECGDCLWYISQLLDIHGIDLETAAIKNVEKLRKRFPVGFRVADSINRKD
jgi:NTP pyrophosphatase (non-canonical NTP hydrolase)